MVYCDGWRRLECDGAFIHTEKGLRKGFASSLSSLSGEALAIIKKKSCDGHRDEIESKNYHPDLACIHTFSIRHEYTSARHRQCSAKMLTRKQPDKPKQLSRG